MGQPWKTPAPLATVEVIGSPNSPDRRTLLETDLGGRGTLTRQERLHVILSVVSDSFLDPMESARQGPSVQRISSSKNTELVAMPSSVHLPTQRSNPHLLHLLHCKQILSPTEPPGSLPKRQVVSHYHLSSLSRMGFL